MAYGQTGSGKTFTMGSEKHGAILTDGGGGGGSALDDEGVGLIPRFMADIFSALEREKEAGGGGGGVGGGAGAGAGADPSDPSSSASASASVDYRASASFLEVYGESVHDLLDEGRASLPMRDDGDGGVVVVGLRSRPVRTAAEALGVLHQGTTNRTTAATLMNHQSSRSHAIFTVRIQRTVRGPGSGSGSGSGAVDVTTTSRFTFVDLAGSERMKKTGAEGARAREGIKINEGLLALGNVINALGDAEHQTPRAAAAGGGSSGRVPHVPYRQSKLTRLLQEALGGNSRTLFLACVSPSASNASETLSTLHYANRARNIKNAPTKNVDEAMVELQRLSSLNYVLQAELVRQVFRGQSQYPRAGGRSPSSSSSSQSGEDTSAGASSPSSADLLRRKDVQEYMERLHRAAEERQQRAGAVGGVVPGNRPPSAAAGRPSAPPPVVAVSGGGLGGGGTPVPSSTAAPPPSTAKRPARRRNDRDVLHSDLILDAALLAEINPDEDMAILDQLLEIQHQDQEFDKERREDESQLEQVEGEIEEQEKLLLQLRDSMKVYHDMKDKYEALMGEVQGLEKEKANLASELERAQNDPTKGCSSSIRKKLEKVEMSLARARSETRKHQQMYRKAEMEGKKCRVLEGRITDLKCGKVALMKKQREATAKHRTFMEAKTREVHALRKKERKAGQQVSKLQAECDKHKANLEKRKQYCNKLTGKLKQTESHLMSLLAMRKRELHRRTQKVGSSKTEVQPSTARNIKGGGGLNVGTAADHSQEIKSAKFMLEKMVSDRVEYQQNQVKYADRVAEYSELMRLLTKELQAIKAGKAAIVSMDENEQAKELDDLREHEHNISDIELKLDIVGAELEDLRTKLPSEDLENREKNNGSSEVGSAMVSKSEEAASKMISKLEPDVVRTILWEMLDTYSKSELLRRNTTDTLKRKESTLQCFESEVQTLNEKVSSLSNEIGERRRLSSVEGAEDPLEVIRQKDQEIASLFSELERSAKHQERLKEDAKLAENNNKAKEIELCQVREELAVTKVAIKRAGGAEEADNALASLQSIWSEVGVSTSDRNIARQQIEKCLELACAQELNRADALRKKTKSDTKAIHKDLMNIYDALSLTALVPELDTAALRNATLMERLEALKEKMCQITPIHEYALERRSNMIFEVRGLIETLRPLTEDKVTKNIKALLKCSEKGKMAEAIESSVEILKDPASGIDLEMAEALPREQETNDTHREISGSLSEEFLDNCEADIQQLKLLKTEILVANGDSRIQTQVLAREMHLTAREVVSLTVHTTKKQRREFPQWWDPQVADNVCSIVTSQDAVIRSDNVFSNHLSYVRDCLDSVAAGRRALSNTLKGVVEGAYKSLLTAVEGEMDASEAYESFHEALFQLPPLSREHIRACIDEMETLVTAVDAMSQSEIEALTVVWDAVSITSSERGRFWSDVEEAMESVKSQGDGPFKNLFQTSPSDLEDWIRTSAMDAKKIYRLLNIRLYKLGKIHEQVETQRSKQDAKSKIISLDSELRILSAKLADFEEKASSKQRLLTKKMNSSALLKEEKFRKQMQSKFAAKLEVLDKLLHDWEKKEGKGFNASFLSDDMRTLLSNGKKSGAWIEQRTAFMHLRTANQRHGRKKVAAYSRATDELPSTKHLVHRATSSSRARASPLRKKKPYKGASPLRSTSAISRRIALRNASNGPNRNPTISSNRPRSHESQTTSSTGTGKATLHNKRQIDPSDESPSKKQHISPEEGDNAKLKARTNNRVDVFHSPPPKGDKGRRIAINTNAGTSNPFANLLSKTPTPSGNSAKENRSLW
jgi:kinesin family protein 4/21/27